MKKIIVSILILFFGFTAQVFAKEPVNVYFFNGDGCPHCAKEELFLAELEAKGQIRTHSFEVWHNQKNARLMGEVGKALGVKTSGVPLTVVGSRAIVGFDRAETTGQEILQLLRQPIDPADEVVAALLAGKSWSATSSIRRDEEKTALPVRQLELPVVGKISPAQLSLPALTMVVGLLDSFNPCAMWVLLFLIGILLNMNSRPKMWLLGSVFLGASAAAYFVFLAAWLNIYQFMGYIRLINIAIALLAIGAGLFSFWDFWVNRHGGCDLSGNPTKRKLVMDKIKNFAQNESFGVALVGLAVVGVAVNMVELLCSAGLPAVYIPILTATAKSSLVYYSYLLVYCFFYILPQLVVFIIAMFSLKQVAVGSRITRWFALASGILMITVGIILLYRPDLLAIFK